ncbi:MAG: 3-hydroxybutyrate dehydrogenase [Deinococcales bacterium]|nr:3-hydroxybutyrate dehydrogenase [Deinococcales bacterium]
MSSSERETRVALVTGAASGIGLACAARLVADGYRVAMVDVDAGRGAARAAELGAPFVRADLATSDGCRAAVEATLAELGGLDVLVCNAGVQHVDAIADFPEERWEHLLRLMLTAPFLLTKHAWEALKRSGRGRVVHVGSAHSLVASPYKAAYVAAKHGLVGLAKVTALEGGEHGITCNVVAPAYVRTPLVEKQVADQARTRGIAEADVEREVFLAGLAIERMLEPSDVAGVVAFLASDAAWAITGSVQSVDLGWTAR